MRTSFSNFTLFTALVLFNLLYLSHLIMRVVGSDSKVWNNQFYLSVSLNELSEIQIFSLVPLQWVSDIIWKVQESFVGITNTDNPSFDQSAKHWGIIRGLSQLSFPNTHTHTHTHTHPSLFFPPFTCKHRFIHTKPKTCSQFTIC